MSSNITVCPRTFCPRTLCLHMLCPHMLHPCTFFPYTIHPRTILPPTICPRMLFPNVFMFLYVSSQKESQPTEFHQPMDWLGIYPSLTYPWVWSPHFRDENLCCLKRNDAQTPFFSNNFLLLFCIFSLRRETIGASFLEWTEPRPAQLNLQTRWMLLVKSKQ